MIDVMHQINAVQRQVGGRVLDPGQARSVTVIRTYDASVEDVWDACTNLERIPRWFLPISGELRVGGRYQLEGNAAGTIERCDPPKSFAATWEFAEDVTWIELRLSPEANGSTRFELEHIAHVDDERWLQFGPGAVGVGWELGLMGLGIHLTSGKSLDSAEFAAWSAAQQGKLFMSLSSQKWRDASVARRHRLRSGASSGRPHHSVLHPRRIPHVGRILTGSAPRALAAPPHPWTA